MTINDEDWLYIINYKSNLVAWIFKQESVWHYEDILMEIIVNQFVKLVI